MMKSRLGDGNSPRHDVVAHRTEHPDPAVSHRHTIIHRVEIEQAHAEARGKACKRHPRQHIERVKAWVSVAGKIHGIHRRLMHTVITVMVSYYHCAKVSAGDKRVFCYVLMSGHQPIDNYVI